mgnify:CR=1 FL=1
MSDPLQIKRLLRRPQFLAAAKGVSEARGAVVIQRLERGDGSAHIGVGFTATRKVGGAVDHYEMSDSGSLKRIRTMGKPAVYYQNIMLVADVNGDGRDDLRGVAAGGRMRTWTSTGTAWKQASATSTGWSAYRTVLSPGDINVSSSKQDDIVAVWPSGRGRMHYGTKGGGQGTSYRNISEGLGSLTYVW